MASDPTFAGEDTDPLLPSQSPSPPGEVEEDPSPKKPAGYLRGLDMAPSARDKLAIALVFLGIALFLPLTWAIVLSGNIREMGWFVWHPPLQSLGIVALLLGITPLQPPPPTSKTRQTRLDTHQYVMLGVMSPAFTIGTLAMWWNKHVHGATHFTTWHSWFGLATVGWMVVQSVIGAASVWFGGKAFGGVEQAKRVYKYHRVSGYVLVTLALVTAHLGGAHSTWALGRQGYGWARVLAFWVGLPLIWVGLEARARPSKMRIV